MRAGCPQHPESFVICGRRERRAGSVSAMQCDAMRVKAFTKKADLYRCLGYLKDYCLKERARAYTYKKDIACRSPIFSHVCT